MTDHVFMSHKTRSANYGNTELVPPCSCPGNRPLSSRRDKKSPSDFHRYKYTRRYQKRHPKAHAAHIAVTSEIRAGRLVRPLVCPQCGLEAKVQAHHDDYNKPLEVRWLCRPCHRAHHQALTITVGACAHYFNCHVGLVRRLIAAGKLAASKVHGEWRLTEAAVDAFLNRHRSVALSEVPEPSRRRFQ